MRNKLIRTIKCFVKYIGCQAAFYSGLFHLYMRFVFEKRGRYPVVIVNYHSFIESYDNCINPEPAVYIPVKDFERALKFLGRYFQIISLDEVVEVLKYGETFPRPTIAITIDDGFRDNYEKLYPLLKRYGVPATIFLTAGMVDTSAKIWVERLFEAFTKTKKEKITIFHQGNQKTYKLKTIKQRRQAYDEILTWLKGLPSEERLKQTTEIEQRLDYVGSSDPLMLNWAQVREMSQNGVDFGAHTMSHPILSRMPLDAAKKEIEDSKKLIEEKLGKPVKHFAYPNGRAEDFNAELGEFCKDIGFTSVSSTVYGCNYKPDDRFYLKRICPCLPLSVFAVYLIRAFKKIEENHDSTEAETTPAKEVVFEESRP